MKKILLSMLVILLFTTACAGSGFTFNMGNDPYYKEGEPTEIVLEAVDDDGEALAGLTITGQLEMEKMDHGTIEITFTDNGDGTYVGEVELPMGGEWIMATTSELDGEEYDHLVRFDVSEG